MGGKDVIYIKQQNSSTLRPVDIQKRLKDVADNRFLDSNEHYGTVSEKICQIDKDIISIDKRRGGSDSINLSHNDWLQAVLSEPDVISMSFIPITSMLNGVPGSGFLSHAINLYLRYKPPMEELRQFLEFQLPRKWAPDFKELPRGPQHKQQSNSVLQFNFLSPKLYVNTIPVDVGMRPVTGLWLYLEGKRSNRLAVCMEHLSSLPTYFQLVSEPNGALPDQESYDKRYFEKVRWRNFSRVCTAPVESDNDYSIVTGAQLQVDVGKRPVTGLRLYLEGKRSNRLAIHLQHLSSLPKIFQLVDDPKGNFCQESHVRKYYEKVYWKNYSHVCTAPIESDEDLSIVTRAQLQVENHDFKNILFLRLRFSTVLGAISVKQTEWDGSPGSAAKSGLISTLISHHFTQVQKPTPRPADVNINSSVYPGGPPVPVQAPKLLEFVDTTEITRGPQEIPGYWVVSGARLVFKKGRISLLVKYSLLTAILPDEDGIDEQY